MRGLMRSVVWRRIDGVAGAETCALGHEGADWWLAGTVVAAPGGVPLAARYRVRCDAGWRTHAVRAAITVGLDERSLRLDVDGHGVWQRDGRVVPDLHGCTDVDLGVTPATNTLPIRRLGLAVGESREILAAWVRFPELTITAAPQRYTRLGPRRYRYEDRGGAYAAELLVDEIGLVERYEDGWERAVTR